MMKGNDGLAQVFLSGTSNSVVLSGEDDSTLTLLMPSNNQPSVEITDSKGTTRAVIGHSAIKGAHTGVVEQHPASSIVLFNDQGNVIWRAP
jgi:hypothetical protein